MRAASGSAKGERKPVTILFADIVGSTSIAEKLDPEEWREIVAGAHQRVGEAIYRYEGTIAQLLGDGVLAFFGAPITHEDDPIRAVRAALDIQESMKTYRQELEGFVDDFQMRIGINTGTVVIGDIGTDLHVEYLAIGDAVNVAARLESAAEPGTVLISETSARLIGDDFELVDRGEFAVKGKSDPLQAYELAGTTGVPEMRRGFGGAQAPYVGREQELETLRSTIHSLREGQGQIVAVLGEPGIGKSRLVAEVRRTSQEGESSEEAEIRWLEGRALSYGGALPFWAVTQLLMSDLGLSEGAAEVRIKVALRKRMEELLGDEAPEFFPYVAHLMGMTEDAEVQDRIRSLDGETVKRQTLLGLKEYFRAMAAAQPTVLVLEDVHWADPSSLEAVMRLLPLTDRVSLMILILMREERDHDSWQLKITAETDFPHRFTEVRLKRLEDDQVDQLVQDLLRDGEAEAEIRDLVRSRAAGNPLYLEEIVQHLMERGLIERANGSWRATDAIEKGGVPETLEGVLLARIDRLEDEVRDTLQLASVIGKSFLYRLLAAISVAERELEEHLTQLQRVDLVREKARLPELEYMFKHALTQEAAYNSLLHERRKEFHAKVGEALEGLFPDREEEFVGLLAHHFDAAEVSYKALAYLIRAGDKARLEDTPKEALAYYERAIELQSKIEDHKGEANTWLKISLVHMKDFNFDAVREAHEAAFELQQSEKKDLRRETTQELGSGVLRVVINRNRMNVMLDPAKAVNVVDGQAIGNIFAGLTELDSETNVIPNVARSWDVRDGGRRYVFHLRDDVFWSDGTKVTAEDFRWTWKRSLSPETAASYASILDFVEGAREFRKGETTDPESVGIHVLDPLTLEVKLTTPVPFFVYLVAHSAMVPVSRHVVEKHGDDWTLPENIVSNGPLLITKLSEQSVKFIRNPTYFGESSGNVQESEWVGAPDYDGKMKAYLKGSVDVVWTIPRGEIAANLPSNEIRDWGMTYDTELVLLNPLLPPLDDLRVRKALAHAIDRGQMGGTLVSQGTQQNLGGVIPRGMPGHSPEIGLEYDLSKATRYFDSAGFPNGKGLPKMRFGTYSLHQFQGVLQQWKDSFGIDPEILQNDHADADFDPANTHIYSVGWVADYPDPDSFFRPSPIYEFLNRTGWEGFTAYDALVQEALQSQDRTGRLEIYRQVDRLLVEEEVLVIPISYGLSGEASLVKPWVHGWDLDALGYVRYQQISVDPQPRAEQKI
ncbi:MAG: ABC transporter substrate-binding protein [Anaerolineales bacterium]